MASVSSRLARGSLWLAGAKILVNLLGILSTIILARLLSPSDFGLVAIASALMLTLASITDIQISQALVHTRNLTNDHLNTAWTLGVARGVGLGVVFGASAPLVADFYGDPRLADIIYAFASSFILGGFSNPRRVILQKHLVFWQDFILLVSQKLAGVAVSIFCAAVFKSYWALVAGVVAGQVVMIAVSYTALPYMPKFGLKYARELWTYSFWIMLSQVAGTVNAKADPLLLGKFLSPNVLGQYSVGDNLSQIPTREMLQPLTVPLFPAFAALRDDRTRLQLAYQRAQAFITAVALPLGIGLAAVADPLIRLSLGEHWETTIVVVQVLSVSFALQTIGAQLRPLALALGETKMLFNREMLMLAIRLPMLFTGLIFYGVLGAIISRFLATSLQVVVNLLMVRQLIGLPLMEQLGANLRAVLSALLMGATIFSVQLWVSPATNATDLAVRLSWLIPVGVFIYLASIVFLWVIGGKSAGPETEVISFIKKINRHRNR